jgi:signal peptidase II
MRKIFWFAMLPFVILVDQFTKYLALKIPPEGIFILQNSFFSISAQNEKNEGIAFSLPLPQLAIFVIVGTLISVLIYQSLQFYKENKIKEFLLFSLIATAAFSNLLDRFVHGAVIDFISVTLYTFNWAVFNFADVVISICTIFAVINILKQSKRKI